MLIHLHLGALQFMLRGRWYDIGTDSVKKPCVRVVWRGQPVLLTGSKD
jgi:hypothetical protein